MIVVVSGLAIAITLFNLFFLYGITKWVEDFIFTSLVEREFNRLQEDPLAIQDVRYPFHAYTSLQAVPDKKQAWISTLKPGIHEAEEPRSMMAAIGEKDSKGSQLIVVVATDELEYIEQNILEVLNFSGLTLLIALVAAFAISFYLIKRVIDPLKTFTTKISSYEPGTDPLDLTEIKRKDEIGQMAEAFDSMQQRIERFIEREKRFTADVSHELRTPLTVVKHSLEMLQTQTQCSPMQDPFLARIDRSTLRMKMLVETFLALARNTHESTEKEEHTLDELLTEAIQFHNLAYPRNPVGIEEIYPQNLCLCGDYTLLSILIRNLVNNAALHAPGSLLTIRYQTGELIFENAPMFQNGIASQENTGIGLSIVERVSTRLGYELTSGQEDGLFRVRLKLDRNPD